MRNRTRNPLRGEIVDGNILLDSINDEVEWTGSLKKLGFNTEEMAEIMASNRVHQFLRDLKAEGKTLSKEGVRQSMDFYRNLYIESEEILREWEKEHPEDK